MSDRAGARAGPGLLRLLRTRGHAPAAERAVLAFTRCGEHGMLWLAAGAAGAALDRPRGALYRRRAAAWWSVAYLANIALKYLVRRRRPRAGGPARAVVHGHEPLLPLGALHDLVRRGADPVARPARRRRSTRARRPWRCRASTWACTTPPTWAAGAAAGHRAGGAGAVKVGIVGLPNAGKSSLFNALTRAGARGGQLPVHHRRAQRGGGAGARRAPGPGGRDDRRHADRVRDDRVPRHRGAGARSARGRGAGQPLPGQHPRDRRARARGARPRRRPGGAPRGPRGPRRRRRDDRDRASLRRPRAGRAAAGEGGPRGQVGRQGREGGRGGAGCASWWPRSARAARPARCRPRRRAGRAAQPQPLTAKPVLYLANVGEGEPLEPPPALARARRGGAAPGRRRCPRASRPSCPSSTPRRRGPCARTSAPASPAWPPSSARRGSCWG